MIYLQILGQNTITSVNYKKRIATNVKFGNKIYYLNYLVVFSGDGKIYTFLDTSNFPGMNEAAISKNLKTLQLLSKFGLNETQGVEKIPDSTFNEPYYELRGNKLRFISNRSNNPEISSWELKVTIDGLFFSNLYTQLPYMEILYRRTVKGIENPKNNQITQNLNDVYVNVNAQVLANSNVTQFLQLQKYSLSYDNAFVYTNNPINLVKVSTVGSKLDPSGVSSSEEKKYRVKVSILDKENKRHSLSFSFQYKPPLCSSCPSASASSSSAVSLKSKYQSAYQKAVESFKKKNPTIRIKSLTAKVEKNYTLAYHL